MTSRSWVASTSAVLALSVLLLAGLAAAVMLSGTADRLDVEFVQWVHESVPRWVVQVMEVLTYAGSGVFLGPLSLVVALLLARQGRPSAAAFVVAAFVSGHISTQALKAAFQRARPELEDPFVQLSTYSFPSGHALDATATYGALLIVLAFTARGARTVLAGLLASAVLLVAASRVILGVHYVLDVTAGIVAGIAVLSAVLLAFQLAPRYGSRRAGLQRKEQPQRPRLDG